MSDFPEQSGRPDPINPDSSTNGSPESQAPAKSEDGIKLCGVPLDPARPPQASATPAPVPAPAPAAPETKASMPTELEKEIEQAMTEMAPGDLAELSGKVPSGDTSAPIGDVPPGTELTGTIMHVTDDDVFLEFGVRSQGVMSRSQFGKKEPLEPGRRVDVVVEGFDEEAGLFSVIRKGQIQRATWTTLAAGSLVEGRVTGLNKGGLEVDLNGIRAFMPASQVDIAMVKDISVFLNETVKAEVIEVDRREKNVLISRRKYLQKERRESRETLLVDLAVGQIRTGTVGNITDFGAFVDLGGVDGLVHISDIKWGAVDKVSDFLKTGQEVQVKVLKIDKKRQRISLGIKQTTPDPWEGLENEFPEGVQLKARVVRLADFGVFAEVKSGVEGLIPISEMSWSRIGKPSDVVAVGDMVDVVVIRVEPNKRRMAMSIKQASSDPWTSVLESFEANSLVKGKVTRLTNFGAFVELVPGVEGLIHISEMADRHVSSCSEVVEPGQEVETRVLGVDAENRRISLSIKAVTEQVSAEEAAPAPEERKPPKKRKKPLRGGLASHWDWNGDLDITLGE